MVMVAGRRLVMAIVTTSLVLVAGLDTFPEAGDGHQVVDGTAPASA